MNLTRDAIRILIKEELEKVVTTTTKEDTTIEEVVVIQGDDYDAIHQLSTEMVEKFGAEKAERVLTMAAGIARQGGRVSTGGY